MNYYLTWHESASVCLQSSVCGEVFRSLYFSLQRSLAALFTVPFLTIIVYLGSATPHPAILPLNPRIYSNSRISIRSFSWFIGR